jgi:hypothetical protein
VTDANIAGVKGRAAGIQARIDEIKAQIAAAQEIIVQEWTLTVQLTEGSGLDSASGAAAQLKAAEGSCDDCIAFLGLAQENLEIFRGGI